MLPTQWTFRVVDSAAAEQLAAELRLPTVLARLLVCRGLTDASRASAFLRPTLDQLHDPMLMLGMAQAVQRLQRALLAHEPMLVYGDYDVDGTVATVLLKSAIERAGSFLGVTADVRYHIPHRLREGYGMQETRIAAAASEGVRLIISVDTGIRGHSAAEEALTCGVDMIITDHHLPDAAAGLPRAVAVLNPNQPGCPYPCKDLCGAAVAFKLAQALLESVARDGPERTRVREKTLPSFLKLLAVATIADAVPLTGENRVIATAGLQELQRPAQSGLRELMLLAGLDPAGGVSASDVGFRLAPRLNAAGRMDVGSDVVELFLAREPAIARLLAEKLHRLNDERRAAEAEALRSIDARLDALASSAAGLPECIVLDDPGWHRGVIGILASRIVDRTARAALVLAHEQDLAYGSGRSVPGYHLLDALTAAHAPDALFARYGGHAHAVGFSLPSASVPELRARMEAHAAANADRSGASQLLCDAELPLSELTSAFFAGLERLAPFGMGNEEPVFLSRGVRIQGACRPIQDKHLRLCVTDGCGHTIGGVAWSRRVNWLARAGELGLEHGTPVDIAFKLRRNERFASGALWEMEVLELWAAAAPADPSPCSLD